MKRIYVFLALIISFSACRQAVQKEQKTAVASSDSAGLQYEKNLVREFAVRKNGIEICLRDWKANLALEKLGLAQDTSSYILGQGADTHKGSVIKQYKYNTVRLQFFGPPEGSDVWLQEIEVTGNDWETVGGIRIGDTETKLKEIYPEVGNEYSGDKNLYRYSSGDSAIEFTLRAGKVALIKIIYAIP